MAPAESLYPSHRIGSPHRHHRVVGRIGLDGDVRICLERGCTSLTQRTRCPVHTKTTAQRGYGNQWRELSKATIAAQPHCSVPGCTSRDLTTDHIEKGSLTAGVRVVCRRHNSQLRSGFAFESLT